MNNRINDGYKDGLLDEERRKRERKGRFSSKMVSAYKSRKRRAKIEKLMKMITTGRDYLILL